jgi:hypothetical protein
MAEEEREGLSDFRRQSSIGLREALSRQYRDFMAAHPTTAGLPIHDRDPHSYIEEVEAKQRAKPQDSSLGIGSLKSR